MAYSTNTAAEANDLLDKIRAFLLAQGWTIDAFIDDNTTYRTPAAAYTTGKRLHIRKTDADGQTMYFNLRSAKGHAVFENSDDTTLADGKYEFELHGIGINGSTGAYSGAAAWDKQSGYTQCDNTASYGACLWCEGTVDYWINQVGDSVNIIVEDATGKFSYVSFGSLKKDGAGEYDGGMFFSGSFCSYQPWFQYNWNSQEGYAGLFSQLFSTPMTVLYGSMATGVIYVDGLDSITNWIANTEEGGDIYNEGSDQTIASVFSGCSPAFLGISDERLMNLSALATMGGPNNLASITPMYSIYAFALHIVNKQLRFLGSVEGIRQISMDAIDNKEEFTLGGDTWKCFPARGRDCTHPWGIPGFAILIS